MTAARGIIVCASVLLLAGCSQPAEDESGHSSTPVQSEQVDDVGATAAHVVAWSELVTEQRGFVDNAELSCAYGDRVDAARVVGLSLRSAGDETSPSYLGVLPVERQQTVDEAIAAADDVVAFSLSTAGPTESGHFSNPQCAGAAEEEEIPAAAFTAFWSLQSVLDAWIPY